MKKVRNLLLVLLAAVLCLLLLTGCGEKDVTVSVTLVNRSGREISSISITPSTSTEWDTEFVDGAFADGETISANLGTYKESEVPSAYNILVYNDENYILYDTSVDELDFAIQDGDTIVFLPPLATPVLGALADRNGGDASWLSALRQGLLDCGVESMDFSDPRVYGSGDCEMMDGLHGGDVIGASLVRDMGDRQPWLRDMLHREYLSHVLRERRGLAAVPDERLTALPEADFLGLHCAKKRRGEATPRF